MVPNQLALYEAPLKRYFDQVKAISFEQEAGYFDKLVVGASRAKFAFAGFVDPQGALVATRSDGGAPAEYWGWSARSQAPALLLRGREKIEAPLGYSPVFVFLGDRRHIWEQAAKATAYPVPAGTNLPPL